MNYEKIYNSIIFRAKNREKPKCYTEKHHIIPKSMGGGNEKENIAILTAREHFLAHWLLCKIHNNESMIYAFFAMTKPVGNGRVRYSSRSFEYARKHMAELFSKKMKGCNHAMFGLKGDKNPNFGSKRSEETKKILSQKAKERVKSQIIKPRSKKIQCVETKEVFNSISDAKRKYPKGNIAYALKSGGTANGFTFVYYGKEKENKLKGYCSGGQHPNSRKVSNEFGNVFVSVEDAGKSINVTGAAITASIKDKRKCKGVLFNYV